MKAGRLQENDLDITGRIWFANVTNGHRSMKVAPLLILVGLTHFSPLVVLRAGDQILILDERGVGLAVGWIGGK